MSEKQIQKMIRSVAEEKAPGETIQLWSRIKSQLRSFEAKPQRHWPSHLRLAGTALGLAILLAGVVFILSPQGQAWAQEAFQFFTETESNRIPLEDFEATQAALSSGSVTQSAPTADNSEPGVQVAQDYEDLTFDEVQALVDFQVSQPTWLPEDFSFLNAAYYGEGNVVTLRYDFGGNMFALRQEPISSAEDCDLCFTVGPGADIEEVSINGAYGEYVVGVWQVVEENGVWINEKEWINDPYQQMLIWQVDGMAYQIVYTGFPSYMMKADMIAVAESVPTVQVSHVLDDLTFDEVQALVDFEVNQPTWLPDKYEFGRALYNQEQNVVTLMYYYGGNSHNALGLTQEPVSDNGACSLCRVVGSSARIQEVSINGVRGEYVEGLWILEDGEAIWKGFSYYTQVKNLIWQTDDMTYNLTAYENSHLFKKDLVAIAESVR